MVAQMQVMMEQMIVEGKALIAGTSTLAVP